MINNLPVVDYNREHSVRKAIDRCPTGAIVWYEENSGPQRGRAAPRIIRQSDRIDTPT